MLAKGYFGQIPILLGLRPAGNFRELEEVPVRPLARAALLLLVVALAPLLLPYAAAQQAYRALTRSTLSTRRGAV